MTYTIIAYAKLRLINVFVDIPKKYEINIKLCVIILYKNIQCLTITQII